MKDEARLESIRSYAVALFRSSMGGVLPAALLRCCDECWRRVLGAGGVNALASGCICIREAAAAQ